MRIASRSKGLQGLELRTWSVLVARYFASASRRAARFLDIRMDGLIGGWALIFILIAAAKALTASIPPRSLVDGLAMALPFLAVGGAPVAAWRLLAGAAPRGRLSEQPAVRLAFVGKWTAVPDAEMCRKLAAGPQGFLVSLIVGILLNVPLRSLEFLAIVPAVGAGSPEWSRELVLQMTIVTVLMNGLYMACFILALRQMPLFPRALVAVWTVDVLLQFYLAAQLGSAGVPSALDAPLLGFLDTNIKKVAVAMAIWMPYLLISDQVNLRFRQRVRARS